MHTSSYVAFRYSGPVSNKSYLIIVFMMAVAVVIRTTWTNPATTLTDVWGTRSRAQGHCPGLPILHRHCQEAETYRAQWWSPRPQEELLRYWCTKNEEHMVKTGFRFFKKWNYKLGLEAKWSCFHINNTTYSILSTKQEQVTYNDICHWRRNYSKNINVATEVYKNFQIFLIKVGKKLYESRKKTKGTAF